MISTVQQLAGQAPDLTLYTIFTAGTAASLSLCAIVRLPIVLAYVAGAAGSKRHGVALSILFVLGLIAGTILLGYAAGSTREGLRDILHVNKYVFWVLGAGLFVTGVLLSGVISLRLLPARWQKVAGRLAWTSTPGAFLLGCAFGLLQTPTCPSCGSAIRSLVEAAAGRPLSEGFALYAVFAVGQGLAMLAVGLLTSLAMPYLLRRLRTSMCSLEQRIQLLAGNVLMVLGVYFVIVC